MLRLLLEGMSNAEIAQALALSQQSVREHMASLLWKYGLPKRRHTLVARLLRRGQPREFCPKCERRREWLEEEREHGEKRRRRWTAALAPAPRPEPAFRPSAQFAARWQEILALEARAGQLREQLQADIAWDWVKQARRHATESESYEAAEPAVVAVFAEAGA